MTILVVTVFIFLLISLTPSDTGVPTKKHRRPLIKRQDKDYLTWCEKEKQYKHCNESNCTCWKFITFNDD